MVVFSAAKMGNQNLKFVSKMKSNVFLSPCKVPLKKIRKMVKDQRLAGYVETSAMRGGEDVDRVFNEAVRVVMQEPETKAKTSLFCPFM